MYYNKANFYGEVLLAPRPTPKMENHLLLPVRDCLFNIFAATLHIAGPSSIRNLRKCHGDRDPLITDQITFIFLKFSLFGSSLEHVK